MKPVYLILFIGSMIPASSTYTEMQENNPSEWQSLFDGKTLDGWEPKIRGRKLGENFKNTFRVKDGAITVAYDEYESFNHRYGHLFYTKKAFKNYHLKLDYRFIGDQAPGGQGWATKNSGVMLHSEDPSTMLVQQRFPVSVEGQFLGGLNAGSRPTANMCSPGTEVDINSKMAQNHCVYSNSKTYHDERWVSVEFIVYSDSLIRHIVEKETVMLAVLQPYLPDALSDEDLAAFIAEALTHTNAESMRDMGQVMGWLKPKLHGKADMAAVSAVVREQLNR